MERPKRKALGSSCPQRLTLTPLALFHGKRWLINTPPCVSPSGTLFTPRGTPSRGSATSRSPAPAKPTRLGPPCQARPLTGVGERPAHSRDPRSRWHGAVPFHVCANPSFFGGARHPFNLSLQFRASALADPKALAHTCRGSVSEPAPPPPLYPHRPARHA